MLVTGRITHDATVRQTKDDREVLLFAIALNENYQSSSGEWRTATTYCNCACRPQGRLMEALKKGTLVEVYGHLSVRAYAAADGTPKAALDCRVRHLRIHAWPKAPGPNPLPAPATNSTEEADDIPF